MTDKLTPQVRIILATVLSFLFFALYDHFFIPKNPPLTENTSLEQNATPSTTTSAPEVKSASSADVASAPMGSAKESEIITTIKAAGYEVQIDRLGRIAKFYLEEGKYKDDKGERFQLIDASQSLLPLEIRFSDKNVNADAFVMSYSADKSNVDVTENGSSVVLTQTLGSVNVIKTLTFFPSGKYDLHIKLSTPKEYFVSPGFRPSVAVDGYTFHGALIKKSDGTVKTIDDGSAKGDERFSNAKVVAGADKYYTTFFYELDKGLESVVSVGKDKDPLLFVKGNEDFKLSGYIGPKEYVKLKAIKIGRAHV